MGECSYDASQFASWFDDCDAGGTGNKIIPAKATICDDGWWLSGYANDKTVTGRYAIWYKDSDGEIWVAISEPLTLLKP